MNILRNKAIAEAYNSIYEKTNIDGTIDDISKHNEILHILSKEIIESFIENFNEFLYNENNIDCDLYSLERNITYNSYKDTIVTFPSKYTGDDKGFTITLPSYYNLNVSDEREKNLILREIYAELNSLNYILRDSDDIYDKAMEQIYKQLKLPIGVIKLKYINEKLVGILEKTISFVTIGGKVIHIMAGLRIKISSSHSKARIGKSAAFRKNLSSPNFPDKEIDKE